MACGTAATQIAAVLPAATPVGTGTITVTYNGTPSAAAPIQVVPTTFGIDNYDGNTAVVTDAVSGAVLTYTNSAKPGEIVIMWGTGLGADPADSDTTYISSGHMINTPLQVYVGGVQVTNIAYAGSSVYPGVDVIGFTIPSGVPNGCLVPIIVVTGANPVVSNTPTLPVMNNGGVCSDSQFSLNGTQIASFIGNSTTTGGSVIVGQVTGPSANGGTATNSSAIANFDQTTGGSFANGAIVTLGGCTISETLAGGGSSTTTGLDPGTLTVTGPSGGAVTLNANPNSPGQYFGQLASGAVTSGSTFTFNGSGGSGANSVGSFSAAVTFPNPLLSWTNQVRCGEHKPLPGTSGDLDRWHRGQLRHHHGHFFGKQCQRQLHLRRAPERPAVHCSRVYPQRSSRRNRDHDNREWDELFHVHRVRSQLRIRVRIQRIYGEFDL